LKYQDKKSTEDKITGSLSKSVPGAKIFYEKVSEFNSMLMLLQKDSIINKGNASAIFKPDDFDADLKDRMSKPGIAEFVYYWASLLCKGRYPVCAISI
jgi:hypothetical protein